MLCLSPPDPGLQMLPFSAVQGHEIRWFQGRGSTVCHEDRVDVFVAGTLIGCYEPQQTAMRNILLVCLAEDPGMHLGQLAAAFRVSDETLRQVRRLYSAGGLEALLARPMQGGQRKVDERIRTRVEKAFEEGLSVTDAHERVKRQISRSSVGTIHQEWKRKRRE